MQNHYEETYYVIAAKYTEVLGESTLIKLSCVTCVIYMISNRQRSIMWVHTFKVIMWISSKRDTEA